MLPILYDIVGAFARAGLVSLSTYLVQHHIINAQQGDTLTTELLNHIMLALPGVAAVAWAIWKNLKGRIRLNTALWMGNLSEQDVRDKVKSGQGIKATATLLVLLAAAWTASACASNAPTPAAAVADAGTKVQQSANVLLHAAQTANATIVPATGKPLLSRSQLDDVAIAVDAVGRAGQVLTLALKDYTAARDAGSNVVAEKAAILRALDDIQRSMAQVGRSIPPGTLKTIDDAVNAVFSTIAQLKASQIL